MNECTPIYEGIIDELIIDPEFQTLFPRLNDEDFAGLEESLCKFGCLSPLTTWNNILIDGHNRFEIIQKHDLPFRVVHLDFDTREEVIIWMIGFQLQSRNLDPMQLSYYRGLHYNTEKQRLGDVERFAGAPYGHAGQLEDFNSTAEKLAEEYDVSPRTIRRDGQLASAIIEIGQQSPEAKERILSGRGNISRKRLLELPAESEDEFNKTIAQIKDGTHRIRRSSAKDPSEPNEQLTFDGFIERIAAEIDSGMKKLTDGNNDASRIAIRSLIDKLERIYENM